MFMSPQLRSQVRNIANSFEPSAPVITANATNAAAPVHFAAAQRVAKVDEVTARVQDLRRSVRIATPRNSGTFKEYARGLLRTKVYVRGHELEATIDWGSSVNLISLETARMLNLDIRKDPKLYMVPVDGRTRPFYGVTEGLPISIGDITTHSHCMVAKDCTAEILLGRI